MFGIGDINWELSFAEISTSRMEGQVGGGSRSFGVVSNRSINQSKVSSEDGRIACSYPIHCTANENIDSGASAGNESCNLSVSTSNLNI